MIFDGNFIPKSTGFVLEMKVVYCLESSQIGGNTPLFCFSALEHQRDDAVEEVLLFLPRILAKACSSNLLRDLADGNPDHPERAGSDLRFSR